MVCIVRTILVLASWGIAIGIPRFELCLAFVGSLATSILAFILPPLFHLALNWRASTSFEIFRNVLHIILLVIGVIATLLATGINLYMAIEHPGNGDNCTSIQHACVATTNHSSNVSYMYY